MRPVRPEDAGALRALCGRMSARSLYLRYHRAVPNVSDEEIARFTDVDYADTFALAATLGEAPEQRIIAVGLYSRTGEDRAEVAFTVEDSHQGRGIATQLLDQLAIVARDHGIHTFEADVLSENLSMMEVFRESGFPLESRIKYGTYHVAFPIAETRRQRNAPRIARPGPRRPPCAPSSSLGPLP
jgi:RimJ/RimL family protein N-acetyltransferase